MCLHSGHRLLARWGIYALYTVASIYTRHRSPPTKQDTVILRHRINMAEQALVKQQYRDGSSGDRRFAVLSFCGQDEPELAPEEVTTRMRNCWHFVFLTSMWPYVAGERRRYCA